MAKPAILVWLLAAAGLPLFRCDDGVILPVASHDDDSDGLGSGLENIASVTQAVSGGASVGSYSGSSSDALYDSWMQFLEVRTNQSAVFNAQFPVDERLYGNVRACGRPFSAAERREFESADTLAPAMVEIYAEIGHLTTFCAGENPPHYSTFDPARLFTQMNEEVHVVQAQRELTPPAFDLKKLADAFSTRCISSLQSASRRPSLARILRAAGADRLEVFEAMGAHDSLQAWTQSVLRLITSTDDYERRWKFILLAPGLFDIPLGGTSAQLADDVTQSLELIHNQLPVRTYVVVLRDAGFHFWQVVESHYAFCRKLHALWHLNTTASAEKWRILEARINSNYHIYDDFYVEMMDLMEGASPISSRDYGMDVSVLSADCAHLSSRGVALLHTHVWNRLVQPSRHHRHRHRHSIAVTMEQDATRDAHQRQGHNRRIRRWRHGRAAATASAVRRSVPTNAHAYTHAPASAIAAAYERVHGSDPSSPTAFAPLPHQPDVMARSSAGAWSPLVRALFCPRPKCPYFLTERNRQFCARIGQLRYTPAELSSAVMRERSRWDGTLRSRTLEDSSEWSVQPTLFALLVLSIALYGALTLYTFCLK